MKQLPPQTEQSVGPELQPSILVVDDNPLIVNVLNGLFASQKYDVRCASNGKEALELLQDRDCDVIVCDVMMPELNGYGLFEKVRAIPEYSHIPFIFLTALSEKRDIQEGIASGADDYIVKPFDPEHLLSLVKGKVSRSRGIKQQNDQKNESFRKRIIHTLSHEFRTPLVAINTGTELLLDQSNTIKGDKAKSLLEAIQRGGQRLEKLVNDFMLMQQVEAGIAQRLYDTRSVEVSPGEVVAEFLKAKDDFIQESGFAVTFQDFAQNSQVRVYVPQFQEIVWRLIENAMKFSGEKKEVNLVVVPRDAAVGIEVRDRGIGVNVNQVGMALDTFGQINREKLEQQGGGLGLALVKRYAVIHGGEFSLEA
ncbi:MAG: hybrid sensor histidine kinase/response regulator, partial [Bdellovibrionales bacterium]|nr:hybrid sensor histidine kinase/response regulator [Bdellovibrionales bacterium]